MIESVKKLLEEAEKKIRLSDHMTYITYPLVKDVRLLKNILEQLYNVAEKIIMAVLSYEYTYKRIGKPRFKAESDFVTFKECSKRFNINEEELEKIKALLELMEKHKKSSLEFTRKDRLVFMLGNARTGSVNLEEMKSYLYALKNVLKKVKEKIESFEREKYKRKI
ncbi:MAG TPA: hypothetical protein ENF67_00355 [Candidatus Pacearchaeota archaeon]|nr:hypothetical protein [Candidatus Pacearchaeota archaeon]